MSEFYDTLQERVRSLRLALEAARLAGDDFLADVHEGDLDGLGRLAREHGVAV